MSLEPRNHLCISEKVKAHQVRVDGGDCDSANEQLVPMKASFATSSSSQVVIFLLMCFLWICYVFSPLMYGKWEFQNVWDDEANMITNTSFHGFTWENIRRMATLVILNVYEPIAWLVKAVIFEVAGLDSKAFRLISAMFHIASSGMLGYATFLLFEFLYSSQAAQNASSFHTSSRIIACITGATVYCIHPVNIEVVGWPSAQSYTVAALASSSSIVCYIRSKQTNTVGENSINRRNNTISMHSLYRFQSLGLYLVGALSKSVCVLLPAAFILIDLAILFPFKLDYKQLVLQGRSFLWICVEKFDFVAFMFILVISMKRSNLDGEEEDADTFHLNTTERIIKAVNMVIFYVVKMVWPTNLRPHYQVKKEEVQSILLNDDSLLSFIVLFVSPIAILWIRRHHQHGQVYLLCAWLFYLVMFLPGSGIIQHGMITKAADRYAYFPYFIMVPICARLTERLLLEVEEISSRIQHRFRKWPIFFTIGGVRLLLGVFAHLSHKQLQIWRSQEDMIQYSLKVDPTDWRMLDMYAEHLMNAGHSKEDWLPFLARALLYLPKGSGKSVLLQARNEMITNRYSDGCNMYLNGILNYPKSIHMHNNVAMCYVHMNMLDKAREHFLKASKLNASRSKNMPLQNLVALDHWNRKGKFVGIIMW